MTHANRCLCPHCASLREARATSDYWRSPVGITRRIEMLSEHFTYQVVNHSLMFYGQSAGINWVRWVTMADERVCFPAGTRITTLHGDRPIEDIQVGERVLTREGYKKVVATTSRPYSGRMVTIEHEAGWLSSTANHPIWKVGTGWLDAVQIKPGDFLNTVDNKHSRVSGVLQFTFTDPHNIPPLTNEVLGLPSVPCSVPMPVIPIDFQRHPKLLKQEIDAISPYPSLLNIFNIEIIKDFTNLLFQQGFALILTIARKATELTISISRQCSELLSAIPTVNKFGWTPTNLTTVTPIQVLLTPKNLTTALTGDILSLSRSTLPTTNRVSIRNGAVNLKGLTALWANLFNLNSRTSLDPTLPRTISFSPLNPTRKQVKLSATLGADTPLSSPFPLRGFGLHKEMMNGHNNHLLLPNYIKVFNLEVEDEPEYYANGVLVHNCPICGPLEGRTYRKGQFLPPLPAHANCRCVFELIRIPEEIPPALVKKIAGTGFLVDAPTWSANLNIVNKLTVFLLLFLVDDERDRVKKYTELQRLLLQQGYNQIEVEARTDEELEFWVRRGFKVTRGSRLRKNIGR